MAAVSSKRERVTYFVLLFGDLKIPNWLFLKSMLLSNLAIQWCLIFLIIYWIFRWYLIRYYSMISIQYYYLDSCYSHSLCYFFHYFFNQNRKYLQIQDFLESDKLTYMILCVTVDLWRRSEGFFLGKKLFELIFDILIFVDKSNGYIDGSSPVPVSTVV